MPSITVVHVKYLEKDTEADEIDTESSSNVIKGNPREVMVNIDCPIGLIIDYVRKVASLEGEIDLCEESTNQMKNVNNYAGWVLGTEIFMPSVIYFIIKIERDPDGRITQVLPMVKSKASKIASDIMLKIQPTRTKRRSTSLASKKSVDKNSGKHNHQEKKLKNTKPASRATEANGSRKKIV